MSEGVVHSTICLYCGWSVGGALDLIVVSSGPQKRELYDDVWSEYWLLVEGWLKI